MTISGLIQRTKKIGISIFIFSVIWIQISINSSIYVIQFFAHAELMNSFISYPVSIIQSVDIKLKKLGRFTGLDTYWRMFAPPNKVNWYYKFQGTLDDSKTILLLNTENRKHAGFIKRNFINFREDKFEHNLYRSKSWQHAYAIYICRLAKKFHPNLVKVSLYSNWKVMRPVEHASPGNMFYPQEGFRLIDHYECK